MSDQDPSPVGEWQEPEQGEVSNEPDAARADDQSANREQLDEEPNV